MRYQAFLSYSRADERAASWLHAQLDRYRTPRSLVDAVGALGPVPQKLHPIFRDRTDMSGGGELSARIDEALAESERLIVLCSPSSAASEWVDTEVRNFIALDRGDRIFPVIAGGLGDSDDVERDFFPPSLRGRGLLAADLRDLRLSNGKIVGDGREGARAKLIAGLLGLGLDQLLRRERRRQRAMMAALVSTIVVFAALAAAAVGFGWLAQVRAVAERQARQDAEENAIEAEHQRDEAQRQTLAARTAQTLADRNAQEREIQRLLALGNAQEARATLLGQFALRAREYAQAESPITAARYALAGAALAEEEGLFAANIEEYRVWLAHALHYAGDIKEVLPHGAVRAQDTEIGRFLVWEQDSSVRVRRPDKSVVTLTGLQKANYADVFPDGARVFVTASEIDPGGIWDTQSGALLVDLAPVARWPNRGSQLFGKGTLAFSMHSQGGAELREVADGRVHWSFADSEQIIEYGALSQDRRLLLMGGPERATLITDQKLPGRILPAPHGWPWPAAFSPDGSRLAIGLATGVEVFDTATGAPVLSIPTPTSPRRLRFSPDGGMLACGHGNGLLVWDVASNQRVSHLFGLTGNMRNLDWSSDGAQVMATSSDAGGRIWRVGARTLPRSQGEPVTDQRDDPAVSDDDVLIAVHTANNGLEVRERTSNRVVHRMTIPRDRYTGRNLLARIVTDWNNSPTLRVFAPDRSAIVAVNSDTAHVFDLPSGALRSSFVAHNGRLSSLIFSSDGSRIATGGEDLMVRLWDARSGVQLFEFGPAPANVTRVRFSTDGSYLYGITRNGATISANVGRFAQDWPTLRRDACTQLLEARSSQFTAKEMGDPLLAALWSHERKVCGLSPAPG